MEKQEKIREIARKLSECRTELMDIRDESVSSEWAKVRNSLSSAIAFLIRADRQITAIAPMEGQIDMFSFMSEQDEASAVACFEEVER